jgi:hypothetical protein
VGFVACVVVCDMVLYILKDVFDLVLCPEVRPGARVCVELLLVTLIGSALCVFCVLVSYG